MKISDKVKTPHGSGIIVAIELSKAGKRYGVQHREIVAKLPQLAKDDDVIYYDKEELEVLK